MTRGHQSLSLLQGSPVSDLPPRLGVAVSGGSDSLATLHLLNDLGTSELFVATVDHGLRPEAADEAAGVAETCAGLRLSHATLRWEGWDGRGNLQDQARRSRYSILAEWGRALGLDAIALGHTMDDQAETFLMRLAREAGVDGLSAMAPDFTRHGMRFLRPCLHLARADLRAFLSARDIGWIDDPSNENDAFDRVKARKALEALAPLGITAEGLSRVANTLASARHSLALRAQDIATRIVRVTGGDVIFDRSALRRLPPEDRHRLLAHALKWVSGEEYPPRARALADLAGPLAETRNATLHGCRILISDMTARITREHSAVQGLRGPTDAPWDGRWTLTGPHAPDLEVRALGEAVAACPDWRGTGLPRATLLASPAVWHDDLLIAAPVAGMSRGWSAIAPGKAEFISSLIAH